MGRPRLLAAGMVGWLIFVTGCTAPQYDEQTDRLISQLQTDVDTQIVSLITLAHKITTLSKQTDAASVKALADAKTKAGYDANTAFYDKIDVELISLRTRVDAEPSAATPFLDNAIQALSDNLVVANGSMQVTHQKVEVLSADYLGIVRRLVDVQISALLTRELGLKNGASAAGAGGATPK